MQLSKRQSLQPCLQVVATPIGNLGDLSPRAREALQNATGCFCEDTRVTQKLLHALQIATHKKCVRLDAHSSADDLERACETIGPGETWALVSDAGTPAISDPGSRMVALARSRGIRVEVIAGPSALASFLSISGVEAEVTSFMGFFPRKEGEQKTILETLSVPKQSTFSVWFESGNRIERSLSQIQKNYPEIRVVVAKELTKLHEQVWVGRAEEILNEIRSQGDEAIFKGEWVFGILFNAVLTNNEDYMKALQCLLNAGVSASEAARQVSQVFGVARNEVYRKIISGGD